MGDNHPAASSRKNLLDYYYCPCYRLLTAEGNVTVSYSTILVDSSVHRRSVSPSCLAPEQARTTVRTRVPNHNSCGHYHIKVWFVPVLVMVRGQRFNFVHFSLCVKRPPCRGTAYFFFEILARLRILYSHGMGVGIGTANAEVQRSVTNAPQNPSVTLCVITALCNA